MRRDARDERNARDERDAASSRHAAHPADPAIAERIRRFRLSWHASDLWPGVTEADFLAGTEELARVTAAIARQDGRAALAPAASVRVLGIAAHVSGLGPLVGYWIERGWLDAPPEAAALFAAHLDHGRRRAARLRGELERVLEAFESAGIAATVLKGMYTAWVYFPEPGTRPMADLDLLISGAALPAAREALTALGLSVAGTSRGRATWRPAGPRVPHSLERTDADDPWELDLHVSLDRWLADAVPARLGPVRPDELIPVEVGGRHARALGQPLLTAHLAVHVSDHFEMTQLVRLVELAAVIRRDGERGALQWDALLARLRATGAAACVYPAFALTEKLFPGTIDPAFRAAIRDEAPAAVCRVVDRTEPGRAMRMFGRSADLRAMWLTDWRSRLRWVMWRLWPRVGDAPAPLPEAARIMASRVLRVLTGRMRLTGTG